MTAPRACHLHIGGRLIDDKFATYQSPAALLTFKAEAQLRVPWGHEMVTTYYQVTVEGYR